MLVESDQSVAPALIRATVGSAGVVTKDEPPATVQKPPFELESVKLPSNLKLRIVFVLSAISGITLLSGRIVDCTRKKPTSSGPSIKKSPLPADADVNE